MIIVLPPDNETAMIVFGKKLKIVSLQDVQFEKVLREKRNVLFSYLAFS